MTRKSIQSIYGKTISRVFLDRRGGCVFVDRTGKPFMICAVSRLFDGDGNYFEDPLETGTEPIELGSDDSKLVR